MDSYAAVRANCHQKAAARVALRSTHERMAKTWQARLRGVTTGNFGTEAIPRTAPIKYLQSIINIMVQNEGGATAKSKRNWLSARRASPPVRPPARQDSRVLSPDLGWSSNNVLRGA